MFGVMVRVRELTLPNTLTLMFGVTHKMVMVKLGLGLGLPNG